MVQTHTHVHALVGFCVAACVFSTSATCGGDVRDGAANEVPRRTQAWPSGDHWPLTCPGSEFPAVRLSCVSCATTAPIGRGDCRKHQAGDLPDGPDFRPAHLAACGKAWEGIGDTLTDEIQPDDDATRVVTRVVPKDPVKKGGGRDEWEIAGSWSTLDVSAGGINGGRLTDLTAGLEWHLNHRMKVQFNYGRAFLERSPTGVIADADTLAARTQIDF